MGCFFYGYVSTHIIGSWLSLKFGFKKVLLVSTLTSGILTLLFPVLVKFNLYAGVAARILAGAFSGPAVPVSRGSLALWAPREERSRLVALQIIGCPIGKRFKLSL